MNRRDFFKKGAEGAAGITAIGIAHKVQAVENPNIEKPQLNVPLISTTPETQRCAGCEIRYDACDKIWPHQGGRETWDEFLKRRMY